MDEGTIIRNPSEKFLVVVPEDSSLFWPVFSKILDDLCNYNDANSLEKDVEKAKRTCLEHKTSYMQLAVLHSSLIQAVNKDVDGKFTKNYAICNCKPGVHTSSLSLKKYVSIGLTDLSSSDKDTDGLRCFGISRNFFASHFEIPDKKLAKNIVSSEVTNVIIKLCKSVLSFYRQDVNDKMLFPKMSKFPDMLNVDCENLVIEERNIERDKKTYLKHIDYYFESMVKGISLLCDKYELQEHSQVFFSSIAHFYAIKADALSLKVKLLQLQILNDTYNSETVSALKAIKGNLQVDTDKLEQELTEKSSLLESYETVGGVFQNLVKEYSALCIAIKNEKWAFEELNKSEKK